MLKISCFNKIISNAKVSNYVSCIHLCNINSYRFRSQNQSIVLMSSGSNRESKASAYQQLLDSISGLSETNTNTKNNSSILAKPMIPAPVSYLKVKESIPLADSSTLDLNQLAMAYFTGTTDVSNSNNNTTSSSTNETKTNRNIEKAIEYWSETAERGDVEGSYQIASIQYEGKYMKQNILEAFEVLEELADDFEHPMSHVSGREGIYSVYYVYSGCILFSVYYY